MQCRARLTLCLMSLHMHDSLSYTEAVVAILQAEETHNTLKFAARAKKVKITAVRNNINDERSQIMMYQQQVQKLKIQLTELKAQAAMSTHTSFSAVAAPVSVDDMHVCFCSF
jgi:predicted RNase H-like nuclease (RuvC/YqgF family)